jgi:hypothetical protein
MEEDQGDESHTSVQCLSHMFNRCCLLNLVASGDIWTTLSTLGKFGLLLLFRASPCRRVYEVIMSRYLTQRWHLVRNSPNLDIAD